MPWPTLSNYAEAIRDFPHISILDQKLKGGKPRRDSNNYLISYSGGFSIVFPIEVLSDTYALRCWIADIGDAKTRYKEISDYLRQCRLPYFVDFAYVPDGIMVNGDKYPVTRMEWAEGETLCDFIKRNLQDARCLKTAAVEFQKMVAVLHDHQISHGDLQDGNILLKRSGTDVEIKLIDYDSVFVPALRGQPDTIVGVPAYQHPQRIAGGGRANEKVDYFSELVIYLSLLSLVEKPDLWHQFGAAEKRLLFKAEDFKNPDQSDVFRELENLSPDVKQLALKLKEFCTKPSIDQLEPLEVVLPKISPAKVAHDQGLAYLHGNQYNEAIVEFEKAIVLDPNYKEAYHGLGLAHFQMNNFGEAKRAAETALRIDPHYRPARQLLDAVLRKASPAQVAYNQGIAYLNNNRYNEAVGEFEKAIGLDPNYKEAHHGLGLAHLKMNNPGEAKRAAEAALGIDPHYQPAHQLVDVIKSFKPPPPPPPPDPVKPTFLERVLNLWQYIAPNLWQYITSALAFILMICIVVLATQISAKDEALRRIEMLVSQQVKTDSELDATTSSIRTLSNEKVQLLRENQRLQNQLTEQDEETKTQIATVRQLRSEKEELRSQNRKLRNQLTEQDKATKTQIAVARREKGELYSQNQILRDEKEQLHSQNQELRNENTMLQNQSELDAATSSIRTLSNEKVQLLRENQKLRNQLTEQNKETKTQIAIVQQLQSKKEELLSQKRKLQNENARLREQLDKRRPPRDPPERFRAAPLQKISSNSRPQVRKAAMSKNNQGYFAFESRYKKAVGYFEEARKSDSQSAVVYYNLGSTYLEIKEYTKSVNYLREAVNLDPKFKKAYYNLALAYLRWGYRQEAKKAAQAALNIDRNYGLARQLLDYINRLMEIE